MNNKEQETYWPGYVDALSNMVLALIFVVLVLALTLSSYSLISARKVAEELFLSRINVTDPNPGENADNSKVLPADSSQPPDDLAILGGASDVNAATLMGGDVMPPRRVDLEVAGERITWPQGVQSRDLLGSPPNSGLIDISRMQEVAAEVVTILHRSLSDIDRRNDSNSIYPMSVVSQQSVEDQSLELFEAAEEAELVSSMGDETAVPAQDLAHSPTDLAATLQEALETAVRLADRLAEVPSKEAVIEAAEGLDLAANLTLKVETQTALPSAIAPDAVTGLEDQILRFVGSQAITIASSTDAPISVILSSQHGRLGLSSTPGVRIDTLDAQSLKVTGPPASVNRAITGLTYLGGLDFFGTDVLELQISPSDGLPHSTKTRIDILPVNDPPKSLDSHVTAVEDMDHVFRPGDFRFTDVERHPLRAVIIDTLPAEGTLLLEHSPIANKTQVPLELIEAGQLRYRPVADVHGEEVATFLFRVIDAGGRENDGRDTSPEPAEMRLGFTATPDAPRILMPERLVMTEDTPHPMTGADRLAVSDSDGDITTVSVSVQNGVLSVDAQDGVKVAGQARAIITLKGDEASLNRALQTLIVTPNADYFGADLMTLTATDASGTSMVALAPITVRPVNDPPVSLDSQITTLNGLPVPVNPSDFNYKDIEGDALAALRIDSEAVFGRLELSGEVVRLGDRVDIQEIESGGLVFRPEAQGTLESPPGFRFSVIDSGGVNDGGRDTSEISAQMVIRSIASVELEQTAVQTPEADENRGRRGGLGTSVLQAPDTTNASGSTFSEPENEYTEAQTRSQVFASEEVAGFAVDLSDAVRSRQAGNTASQEIRLEQVEEVLPDDVSPAFSEGLAGQIVIVFPDRIVALDAPSKLLLTQRLYELGDPGGLTLTLHVLSPRPNLSVERSAAVTRAVSIRQTLSEIGVPAHQIRILIERERRSTTFGEVHIVQVNPGSSTAP